MTKQKWFTLLGLFIAYFSMFGIIWLFRLTYGRQLNDLQVVAREVTLFLMAAILIWVIRQEGLSVGSIGLFPQKVAQSILWAIVTVIVSFGLLFVCLLVFQQIGLTFGNEKSAHKLSLLTTTLVILRAGIVEELFFRGYILERLKTLTNNRLLAVSGSLIPFALFHYSQGIAGIILAFVLGGVLTSVYLWKRDLKSLMLAHFIIDFIPNVVGQLF